RPAPGRRAVRAGTAVWTAPHDSAGPQHRRSGVVRGHGTGGSRSRGPADGPRRTGPPWGAVGMRRARRTGSTRHRTGNTRHLPAADHVVQDTAVQCAEGVRVPPATARPPTAADARPSCTAPERRPFTHITAIPCG